MENMLAAQRESWLSHILSPFWRPLEAVGLSWPHCFTHTRVPQADGNASSQTIGMLALQIDQV